jgi:hypothetical protein
LSECPIVAPCISCGECRNEMDCAPSKAHDKPPDLEEKVSDKPLAHNGTNLLPP